MNQKEESYQPVPPFTVYVDNMFDDPEDEEDHRRLGVHKTITSAIAAARKVTRKSIAELESVEDWRFCGEVGLVHDANGRLVFDGRDDYPAPEPNTDADDDEEDDDDDDFDSGPRKLHISRLYDGRLLWFRRDEACVLEGDKWVPAADVNFAMAMESRPLSDQQIAELVAQGIIPQ